MLETLNYTAALVATLAVFFVGWLWYGPIAGKKWMKAIGMKASDMKPAAGPMIKGLIGTFIMVCVVANLAIKAGYTDPMEAAKLGLLAAFGLGVTSVFGRINWEGASMDLLWINGIYSLVGGGLGAYVYFMMA